MDKEIFEQITKKSEFSKLPMKDIERTFNFFKDNLVSDKEKVRLTRNLLRRVFSDFTSKKLFSLKEKDTEWILNRHISTKERLPYYTELYDLLLKKEKFTIFDLGAGINGFSFDKFPKGTSYVGIEAMGQLVDLMNFYFSKNNLNAKAIHESLFELDNICEYLKQVKGKKIVFLFKAIDSLEILERNYSKKLLKEIVPLVNKVVISFATKSLIRKSNFKVKRNWIINFIKENFNLLDDFELGTERYIVFNK